MNNDQNTQDQIIINQSVSTQDPVIEGLWNSSVLPDDYGINKQYTDHIFEQYKLFIEMADRVSSRRNIANTFFLTLHTFLITAASFLYEKGPKVSFVWFNLFPLVALLILCYVWHRLILSYRQLNEAKYKVIGEYERRLPSSPYWSAEWKALGEGKNAQLYKPLTDLENWVPKFFAVIYIVGTITIIFL
jgi:hypothetical protein